MRNKILVISLILLILLFTNGCGQQTKYVCPNGTTVSDPSLCPGQEKQTYCGDGDCNGNENCNTCPSDCGRCLDKCEIKIVGDQMKCIDAEGDHWARTKPHCGGEESTVPHQTHRGRQIVEESVRCIDDRCVVDEDVLRDCSKFDIPNQRVGLCANDPISDLPGCYGYTPDGKYLTSEDELK